MYALQKTNCNYNTKYHIFLNNIFMCIAENIDQKKEWVQAITETKTNLNNIMFKVYCVIAFLNIMYYHYQQQLLHKRHERNMILVLKRGTCKTVTLKANFVLIFAGYKVMTHKQRMNTLY